MQFLWLGIHESSSLRLHTSSVVRMSCRTGIRRAAAHRACTTIAYPERRLTKSGFVILLLLLLTRRTRRRLPPGRLFERNDDRQRNIIFSTAARSLPPTAYVIRYAYFRSKEMTMTERTITTTETTLSKISA